MKSIKQFAGTILAVVAIFSMSTYAYAEESTAPPPESNLPVATEQPYTPQTESIPPAIGEPSTEPQEPPEGNPVIVNTLDELQAAIEAANDGDTIMIGYKISLSTSVQVGKSDKTITIKAADDFSDTALFYLHTANNQKIEFQNLILDGDSTSGKKIYAVQSDLFGTPDSQGKWNFANVTFQNFNSTRSIVTVDNADALFINCHFKYNYGRRSGGIGIPEASFAEIANCTFSNNQSEGDGAAINCCGDAKILSSSIIGNSAINDGVVKNGGGIFVANTATCKVVSCLISENSADLGGGISCFGTLTLCDTVIFGNTGRLGGSDIRAFRGSNISVAYTDSMNAVYTENNPLGFYADDFENPFSNETNITSFVGETLEIQNNTNPNFGVRFLFATDLPTPTPVPTPTPEPDSDTENQPVYPSPDDEDQPPFVEEEPDYPEIEIVPIPEPEIEPEIIPEEDPVIQAPIIPDPTPASTPPNIESSEPTPAKAVENIPTPEPSSSASIEPSQPQPKQEQEKPVETSSDTSDSSDDIVIVSTDEDEPDTSPLLYATILIALVAASILLYIRFKGKRRK